MRYYLDTEFIENGIMTVSFKTTEVLLDGKPLSKSLFRQLPPLYKNFEFPIFRKDDLIILGKVFYPQLCPQKLKHSYQFHLLVGLSACNIPRTTIILQRKNYNPELDECYRGYINELQEWLDTIEQIFLTA